MLESRPGMADRCPNDPWLEGLANDPAHAWEVWRLDVVCTEQGGDNDDWKPCSTKPCLEP